MISPPRFSFWWLHPAICLSSVCGITLLIAYLQDPTEYELYRTVKYLNFRHLLIGGLTIFTFCAGCYFGSKSNPANDAKRVVNYTVLRRWFYLCVALTLFGYLVWLGVGLKNGASPALFMDVLLSDDARVVASIREDYFPTIPGITTCAQFGMAAMVLGLWLYFFDDRRVLRWLVLIFILALFRAILYSERLALIELVVPAVIVMVRVVVLPMKNHLRLRMAGNLAPIVAPLLLAVLFGSFEYVRSWHYYADKFDSYPQFVVWRLAGYYTTAHNNAAMAIETGNYPPLPYYLLEPVWEFPGVQSSPFAYQKLTGVDVPENHEQMLDNFGNPEFNNGGGLFEPMLELGLPGSLIFWLVYGVLAGWLYQCYLRGTLNGVLFYPLIFHSLLDVPRLLVLCSPRFTPTIVVLILVVVTAQVPKTGRPST